MTYLVTGGCGFIGLELVRRLLAEGHEVIVLDDLSTGTASALPPGAQLIEGQIKGCEWADAGIEGLDGIFHLAAVASVEAAEQQPERARLVNVAGTQAIFRMAAVAGDRPLPVVLTSSAAVYGAAGPTPIPEDQVPRPAGVYGATKLAAEGVAERAFIEQRVPSVAVRLFNVYGPSLPGGRPPGGVIAEFCRRVGDVGGRHSGDGAGGISDRPGSAIARWSLWQSVQAVRYDPGSIRWKSTKDLGNRFMRRPRTRLQRQVPDLAVT